MLLSGAVIWATVLFFVSFEFQSSALARIRKEHGYAADSAGWLLWLAVVCRIGQLALYSRDYSTGPIKEASQFMAAVILGALVLLLASLFWAMATARLYWLERVTQIRPCERKRQEGDPECFRKYNASVAALYGRSSVWYAYSLIGGAVGVLATWLIPSSQAKLVPLPLVGSGLLLLLVYYCFGGVRRAISRRKGMVGRRHLWAMLFGGVLPQLASLCLLLRSYQPDATISGTLLSISVIAAFWVMVNQRRTQSSGYRVKAMVTVLFGIWVFGSLAQLVILILSF